MKFATGTRVTHRNDAAGKVPVVGTVIRHIGAGHESRVHVSWPERVKCREPWWYGDHIPSVLKRVTTK